MVETWAMVFPGQGSQSVGMLREMAAVHPLIREYFERASDRVSYDLWKLVTEGPVEKLNQTEFTQPAVFVSDVALWALWKEQGGGLPSLVAGHSLGEYAALVCSGALAFDDAVDLVALRGRLMQQAVLPGQGAMAVIIGLSDADVVALCSEMAQGAVVSPANYNTKGQVVVAGHADAVDRVVAVAQARGARLAKRIPVSVPSHCALMQPAAAELALRLDDITVCSPTIPLIHNVDVLIHEDAEAIKKALVKQLTEPVRWVETVELLLTQSVTRVVECGPGNVLCGLIKRIDRQLKTFTLYQPEAFATTLEQLQGVE